MLKKGEVDLAYLLDAPQAQEVKRDPTLTLAFSGGIGTFYLDFFDQWDPKSPWHDRRGRPGAPPPPHKRGPDDAGEIRGPPPPRGKGPPQKPESTRPKPPHNQKSHARLFFFK